MLLASMVLVAVAGWASQEGVETAPVTQQAPPATAVEGQTRAPEEKQAITIPAGTRIPLTLANPIRPKAAHRGDPVRAYTAFPVAVDAQVAMPAGVYVEGVVDKLVKKDRWGHPWVEVHFTRMVFPNGYVLQLEAESTEARAKNPETEEERTATHENGPSAGGELQFQQAPPTLPPLPKPNYGPAIGLGVGSAAAAVAIAVLASRHRYDAFWYNVGWQFDMVLESPLRVDAESWNADVGQ